MPPGRSSYPGAVLLLFVACSSAIVATDVTCDPEQFFDQLWRFRLESQGPVLEAEVEFIVNGAELGVLPLNEVDRSGWEGEAFESTVGVACEDEEDDIAFVFAVESDEGRIELEHPWP